MSTNLAAMATPVTPGLQDSHLPSRRMRMSLSVLRTAASSHLTQRDIQALQKKGVLYTATSSNLQDPSTGTVHPQQDHFADSDLSAGSASGSSAVTSRASVELSVRPPLPIAERIVPMMSSLRSRPTRSAKPKGNKPSEDPRLVIHHKERPLRPYHQGIIEDTCSHLHAPAGVFRRHSDSSSQLGGSTSRPASEDTLALDPIRRASIATASPMVTTPLGGRTVLYKASQAHTLLSLPSKTALASVVQTDPFSLVAPTPEMSSFRFPADDGRPRTPPSPALSSTNASAMSPTIAIRSKRKSSIPIRSPNGYDSPNAEPGVIFQFPFGTPPMPPMPYRKSSTPSALPLSSPSASPSQLPAVRSFSPSIKREDAVSGRRSRSGSETQGLQDLPTLFETPRSPASRSGLGIQVRESFEESDMATSNMDIDMSSQTPSHVRPITFRKEDAELSIGDIIVAEQASVTLRQQTQSEHTPEAPHVDQAQSNSMPTPPPTSKVQFTRVMETSASQFTEGSHVGSSANDKLASPRTPFPGFGYAMSQATASAPESTTSESSASAPIRHVLESLSQVEEAADQTLDRNVRAGSTSSSSSFANKETDDNEEQDGEPSMLPLWLQRQRHIRRQSLIPRPELDFVKGNGIIPPANNELVTPGGAVILSYPVLISDIVHVTLDELQAKGVTLDGSDISEESEDDGDQHMHSPPAAKVNNMTRATRSVRNASKRKKGAQVVASTGKRRGSNAGGKPMGHHGQVDEEDYQSGDEMTGDYDVDIGEASSSQVGYMSSRQHTHKRRRLETAKHDGSVESEMLAPTRIVPERHTPSIYRRRDSSNNDGDHRASTSPYLGSATFRANGDKQLGSPIELERRYEHDYQYDQENVTDHDGEYDIDVDIDIDDSEDDGINYQQKKGFRHQQVPEHLRIPAEEVDIAVKLTMEILLESNKKRKLNKDRRGSKDSHHATNHRRPSLKTLKPLLEATMMDIDGYTKKIKSESSTTHAKTATPKAKKTQANGASPKKSPSSANKANGDQAKRPTKAKQGKLSTKKCEACGATETPCWRPGYAPHSALCNSCGLRYKKASVFCPKEGCKYIPVKADYLLMEEERVKAGRSHLICKLCSGPIALPVKKESTKKD